MPWPRRDPDRRSVLIPIVAPGADAGRLLHVLARRAEPGTATDDPRKLDPVIAALFEHRLYRAGLAALGAVNRVARRPRPLLGGWLGTADSGGFSLLSSHGGYRDQLAQLQLSEIGPAGRACAFRQIGDNHFFFARLSWVKPQCHNMKFDIGDAICNFFNRPFSAAHCVWIIRKREYQNFFHFFSKTSLMYSGSVCFCFQPSASILLVSSAPDERVLLVAE